ncbi:MAG TPA: hypothetical protein VJ201_04015 [Candidatus Babeliales bacterium]|nr:hypothetical protein [Candidatus Babeliales bacterium]
MKIVNKVFMVGVIFVVSALNLQAVSKREKFFEKNLCLRSDDIKQMRDLLVAKRDEFCDEDDDRPGCRQALEFIEKIDELLQDGSMEARELFEPGVDAILVFIAHAKHQLSSDQAKEKMVFVADHPDIDLEIPDDTNDEDEF